MKESKAKVRVLVVMSFVFMFVLGSCSREPYSINDWKPWVLSKADVEDYTAMDLVSRFVDERSNNVVYKNHDEKYMQWWHAWWASTDPQDTYDDWELKEKLEELPACYSILAELTLMNALASPKGNGDFEEELAKAYLKELMGDEYMLISFLEKLEGELDLNKLKSLSRSKLKESMVEVIGDPKGFSLYSSILGIANDNWDDGWWDPDVVTRLSLSYTDDFFENIMLVLGDFSELQKMIDEAVDVYNCEYNSSLSSNKADVYDVIYSIKDKMYVKCTILETKEKSEIKMVGKSTHLLSL